ncbi:PLP-dependent aminotransferase family protein [Olleya aquimaris]|uniref:Cys/Met metabolism PLP-dependent enzyme n=1 Tax=Olleya aquimaris TaxID=639310 RepID=A0A327RIU9_9FLAO|nr:PLP-dependent transferase [Olleya aquimaris]RAJ16829.1 Cys/Met metabolism PLP-dependent enzyme [Olleya aquimaris]
MQQHSMLDYIKNVLQNLPTDWLNLTTHRLDIYNEDQAKTEFLNAFETLFKANNADASALHNLPTAYDYIRLGHPLSCVLEWVIANLNGLKAEQVISFSSQVTPILAILRKNLLDNKNTQICYTGHLPECFDADTIQQVYGYHFSLKQVETSDAISEFDGSTIFIGQQEDITQFQINQNSDFCINIHPDFGSIIVANGNDDYISEIQHVRRRETIAMTPINCHLVLNALVNNTSFSSKKENLTDNKTSVLNSISSITGAATKPLVGSSGLSIQYAIMMGLIHDAQDNHKGKAIKFIVPPNCYGGTNDQARRVAACLDHVEIVDLPVDGDNDMVQSIDRVLASIASQDAIPYIIAEIPTNPRVEVPNLEDLKAALSKIRYTPNGEAAVAPVFILDQTFCPNVLFLGEGKILSTVKTISYASGSKFPSGGLCTAGYCVGNSKTEGLMQKIEQHLLLCDNEATNLQYELLAKQLPSMNQRIEDAYQNTREFVNFIKNHLPEAKINFVSEELAEQGFTPSVFSLDLPTKGHTAEEKERYKRALNHKLINLMITKIPDESKYCVSYGQLKGCYWTIPATSTQGTTKEGDKDYIARVALSGNMDLDKHKEVFLEFVNSIS